MQIFTFETPLGKLTALPKPIIWIYGPYFYRKVGREGERKGKMRVRREEKEGKRER